MADIIWSRRETEYENIPGEFIGSVVTTKEKGIGLFTVVSDTTLFSFPVKLPAKDANKKRVKLFETDMSNLMDGVIELKDR